MPNSIYFDADDFGAFLSYVFWCSNLKLLVPIDHILGAEKYYYPTDYVSDRADYVICIENL